MLSEDKKNKIMLLAQQTGIGVMKASELLKEFNYDFDAAKKFADENFVKVFNSTDNQIKRVCLAINDKKNKVKLCVFTANTDFACETKEFKDFMKEYTNNLMLDDKFDGSNLIKNISKQIGEDVNIHEVIDYQTKDQFSIYLHFDYKQAVIIEHNGELTKEQSNVFCMNALTHKTTDLKIFNTQYNIFKEGEKLCCTLGINCINKINVIKLN